MMFKKIFVSREEAFLICDKSQYCESTLWQKVKLGVRYLICRATRAYVNRNIKLTKAMKSSNLECLEYSERKLIEDRFIEHLKDDMQ